MNCSRSVTVAAHSHEASRCLQGPATEHVICALWQYSCYKTVRFSFVTKFTQKLYNWPFFLSFFLSSSSVSLLVVRVEGYCCIWSHPITHTRTVGRTPLGEGSARRRNLYLTTNDTTLTTGINPCPLHCSSHSPSHFEVLSFHLRLLSILFRLFMPLHKQA
jgi:hypothetical protein